MFAHKMAARAGDIWDALLFDSVAMAGCKRAIKFQVASIKCNYWDKEKCEEKITFLSRSKK